MQRILLFLILSSCLPVLWGQQVLSSRINSLLKTLPEGSEVGISVYDLTDKKSLYTYRDIKLSRPASTMKLLTAITALSRSDADEPFRTEVWYNGVIEHDTLRGDLYVVGGFDPEFDELSMDTLIDAIITSPFSVIDGRIYGDISMKDSLYWGSGWAWDDTPEAYQPYLSPLMYHKGMVTVTAAPGAVQGDTARVSCYPESSYYSLSNATRTRTPSAGKFTVTRGWLENKNNITVTGNVEGRRSADINVFSSQDFFMHAFLEKLRGKGIEVPLNYAFSVFTPDSSSVCMVRSECSVQEVVTQIMKESDNLSAEALLCRLGAQATGKKYVSAKEGIAEIKKMIKQLGHNPDQYKIADGCGLSNYDYLSPALLVDFLKFAYSRTDVFQKLYKALPIAGVDGTLKYRMQQGKAYKNVHAKTGSYTAINALAGYLKAANGHEIAFTIMNQNVLSAAKAREFQNKVCEVLCE
ncbi:D-alanyl-D-alanine carboxypeptidase/D-alanyl-D-alanine endopeptidase [Bacteroides nordii]|uniref:D-alanyl-D-alanine carboxypeptidase/D-alanyl-D-alanine endopeptidase n=1 Tax=Bacteroides nordii TaxID=291645 RepID=UPI00203B6731|nr:D-alanyl-D-alanine carboxypeptidase/D-alanyl-D-alanine-endopeptidase [Bacteroides nordii]GFZ38243.1 D-alanyl-D-alanine carboxypeptidase [Bacteroides nordii]